MLASAFVGEMFRSLRRRAKRLRGLATVTDAHPGAVAAVRARARRPEAVGGCVVVVSPCPMAQARMAPDREQVDICRSGLTALNHKQLHYNRVALCIVTGDEPVGARSHVTFTQFRVALCSTLGAALCSCGRGWRGHPLCGALDVVSAAPWSAIFRSSALTPPATTSASAPRPAADVKRPAFLGQEDRRLVPLRSASGSLHRWTAPHRHRRRRDTGQ